MSVFRTRRNPASTMLVAVVVIGVAGSGLVIERSQVSSAAVATTSPAMAHKSHPSLPIKRIEHIEQADGTYSQGVLTIDIDRSNLHHRLAGVKLRSGFEVRHELNFQANGSHRTQFNGELAVRQSEAQHVIDTIDSNHLVFQAMHQHFQNIRPMIWFMHFRGKGRPAVVARRVHRVVKATRVSLPQHPPAHPKTSLPAKRLAKVLGGQAEVQPGGLVTVDVDRLNTERLAGHAIKPGLGVAPNIEFQPIAGHRQALVVPDFGMTAKEIRPVTRTMRRQGWKDECLYNQETAEHPQLYWSHMVKKGDAVRLARQIRRGLDHMNVEH